MKAFEIKIGNVTRFLSVRPIAPNTSVALFNLLGDWQLAEAAGIELAKLVPAGTEALLMPDGKAQALLHVLGRETGLPTYVVRKENKPYMERPLISVSYRSVTTARMQQLYLGADDARKLIGNKIAIVDDVVSSGGTLMAMKRLVELVQAVDNGTLAIFTEGDPWPEVISLGHLPLFT